MYDPEKGKSRRLSLGITVKELADQIGCSTQAVYQWERGERKPSLTTFVVIAHHLQFRSLPWSNRPEGMRTPPERFSLPRFIA